MYRFKTILVVLFYCTTLFLSGCMVGPDFKSPAAALPLQYTEAPLVKKTVRAKGEAGKSQEFILGLSIQADWWTLFHSKSLNQLVERGLQHSPTAEAALAALEQAQQTLKAATGALLPSIGVAGSTAREKLSSASLGTSNNGSAFNLYNASVNVTYILDVFGGTRRTIEGLCAGVDYQLFLLESTYLTLASNIVTTAITEASLRAQIEVTKDLIRSQEQVLDILQRQFELGGISRDDILLQTTEVAVTQAALPPLEKSLTETRNALAILVGSLPSEAWLPNLHLSQFKLPTKIPVSFPSNLVCQRPDIQATEALLHQASAQIGVSTANMLPQFTINGSYSGQSNKLNTLFNSPNVAWNYGMGILQPLFRGGALAAERQAAIAAFKQARARYRQVVLNAFQNVADSLNAIEMDAKTLKMTTISEESALTALTLIKQQFHLGSVNYLSLLNAERQYQLARISRIKAEALRYTDTVALFQALGGGWWNRD